jgi:osmotically-inducible protein OsmY
MKAPLRAGPPAPDAAPAPLVGQEPRTDRRIEDDIRMALAGACLTRASVTIKVINGEALLWGRVSSLAERSTVGRIAASTRGVRQVVNDIEPR